MTPLLCAAVRCHRFSSDDMRLSRFDGRSYVCGRAVSVRAAAGQRGGVQSWPVPVPAPGPRHFPLETPYARINSQAAVGVGPSLSQKGTDGFKRPSFC